VCYNAIAGHKPNIKLKLGNDAIPPASDVEDLGALIDNKFAFIVHINCSRSRYLRRLPEPILFLNVSSRKTYLHLCMSLTFMSDHC
jgi:hypothetical protein